MIMDSVDDMLKSMYEVEVKSGLTLCYKESIHGGLYGFIKQVPNTISNGKDLDELILMILESKEVIEYLKNKM
jgi:hypothetical protein